MNLLISQVFNQSEKKIAYTGCSKCEVMRRKIPESFTNFDTGSNVDGGEEWNQKIKNLLLHFTSFFDVS